MSKLLVTGSSGLIGSEVVSYFHEMGWKIVGMDNNSRASFFGPKGDTRWIQEKLERLPKFKHVEVDIKDRDKVAAIVKREKPDAIVHAAAQPSHDKAASIPFLDFETNALGTLNMLEAARNYCTMVPFIYLSTAKVYGDWHNKLAVVESEFRYDFKMHKDGLDEKIPIDQCTHSLFGVSKLSGDLLVQEYGKYFHMPTVCLRGGCLTGPNHSGVELHGFLSYFIKCNLEQKEYTIFGFNGKQVRDQLHSEDVARLIERIINRPVCGEVFNIGGGKANSCSILEAGMMIEAITGKPQIFKYTPENRVGDHICYYTNLKKVKEYYPEWYMKYNLSNIFYQIVDGHKERKC